MEDTIHALRERERELSEQIADERDKDDPNEDRLDDLIAERDEVRGEIAEYETASHEAEQDRTEEVMQHERW